MTATIAPTTPRLPWLPRGIRLSEEAFAGRHRTLTFVLVLHVPVLAIIAVGVGRTGPGVWVELGSMVLAAGIGGLRLSHRARASAVSFGLIMASTVLVNITGGQTDMHIHFYVILSLVALYQDWTPFVMSIVFVAVHHLGMSELDSHAVFSDPNAQENPLGFALLHAGFLLAMAVGLAAGWRFSEQADAARRAEQARAEEQASAQLRSVRELAQVHADAAAEAAERVAERGRSSAELSARLDSLDESGTRLIGNVSTATAAMEGLVSSISQIADVASRASSTAQEADGETGTSLETMQRLTVTMAEVSQIAQTISGIADQTNLLALNATIEAARAGESGKGFAVVAGEVKELARETAQATALIRGVVTSVQADTAAVALAINRIRTVIEAVVEAQGTIAAAVEEQSAATAGAQQAITGAALEVDRMAEGLRGVATMA